MRRHDSDPPILRFTPYAWAKLIFFRDTGDTEIGGFGITCMTGDDLLLVEDFVTIKQAVTSVTVAFADDAVAEFFDDQVDLGRKPEQFGRIWIHTHPGNSASPSMTDEETFERVFGTCQWAIMFILAKGGETYCRLRFNVGPGGAQLLTTAVDFHEIFDGSDPNAWLEEYDRNVVAMQLIYDVPGDDFSRHGRRSKRRTSASLDEDWRGVLDQRRPDLDEDDLLHISPEEIQACIESELYYDRIR